MIGNSVIVSPDCRRVAYVACAGGKQFVAVDGQEAKRYDRLEEQSLIFSPDSQRLAYVAGVGEKWVVVVDGHEGEGYDLVHQLAFSPDGQRFAYVAVLGKKWVMVVDGQEGEYYYSDLSVFNPDYHLSLVFNPDYQRLVDALEWDQFPEQLVFSPDSQRLAYVARRGWKQGSGRAGEVL